MKKLMMLSVILSATAAPALAQTRAPVDRKLEAQIITLEKQAWKAWQDGNGAWYRDNTTPEFVSINGDGPTSKADLIKSAATACKLKSYSLDHFKIVMLNESTLILTYDTKQDEVCGSEKIPPSVYSSSIYVRRGARWLAAQYMETP